MDVYKEFLEMVQAKQRYVYRQYDKDWKALILAIALLANDFEGEITEDFLKKVDDHVSLDDAYTVRDGSVFRELQRYLEKLSEEQEE